MYQKKYMIRPIEPKEYPLLDEFLYQALFVEEGALLPQRAVIYEPEIYVYNKEFGQHLHDYGLFAEADGMIVGAVWVRILNGTPRGFGNVDDETPEFAISVLPENRKQGVGLLLMKAMLQYMDERGYPQTSLSVNKKNYAKKLYQKVGFVTVREQEEDYIMIRKNALTK